LPNLSNFLCDTVQESLNLFNEFGASSFNWAFMLNLCCSINDLLRKKHVLLNNIGCLFGILLDDGEEPLKTDGLVVVVHEHGIKSIITVLELNDVLSAGPHCFIILNRKVLKSLH
jgi:hypothetical protein